MTLVEDCGYFNKKCLFIALLDYFLTFKFDDELTKRPSRPPKAKLSIAIVPTTTFPIFKYMKKDL